MNHLPTFKVSWGALNEKLLSVRIHIFAKVLYHDNSIPVFCPALWGLPKVAVRGEMLLPCIKTTRLEPLQPAQHAQREEKQVHSALDSMVTSFASFSFEHDLSRGTSGGGGAAAASSGRARTGQSADPPNEERTPMPVAVELEEPQRALQEEYAEQQLPSVEPAQRGSEGSGDGQEEEREGVEASPPPGLSSTDSSQMVAEGGARDGFQTHQLTNTEGVAAAARGPEEGLRQSVSVHFPHPTGVHHLERQVRGRGRPSSSPMGRHRGGGRGRGGLSDSSQRGRGGGADDSGRGRRGGGTDRGAQTREGSAGQRGRGREGRYQRPSNDSATAAAAAGAVPVVKKPKSKFFVHDFQLRFEARGFLDSEEYLARKQKLLSCIPSKETAQAAEETKRLSLLGWSSALILENIIRKNRKERKSEEESFGQWDNNFRIQFLGNTAGWCVSYHAGSGGKGGGRGGGGGGGGRGYADSSNGGCGTGRKGNEDGGEHDSGFAPQTQAPAGPLSDIHGECSFLGRLRL
uniref:Uncharacterized protein n=1 Tax=Chromera velia CCMP2878 TaxID=1169474 RepID=A0A0G4HEZ0_9ALVE|eukprot:Cvel_26934.t1-p1 / transcript=Cvel_26934.t1 / gene=Cvel_26934 / organism=Chromera_velia_CCMP2878 / gene_product=hypothetical protein / transcript_product=hypothetical protein / location=Cvel_scaffold3279:15822-18430(+) / protein_length=517 / sequence_SO=supercontig / SO=protein_coding / is_pseudo=false